MAADEIERFRRDIVERTGDARAAENITDQELLREVMNTVGKAGQLREIVVPAYVHSTLSPKAGARPLAAIPDEQLLGYGVPSEWLNDVRQADEDRLLALAQHLPAEAAEALLELATGGTPRPAQAEPTADPFTHPDAQRRFRVVASVEELERALDAPWDKWAVFLHPEQRQLVARDFAGPARVAGSAGTGKTVVALHRAVHLARTNPEGRILLATFSEPLAHALRTTSTGRASQAIRRDVSAEAYGIRYMGTSDLGA